MAHCPTDARAPLAWRLALAAASAAIALLAPLAIALHAPLERLLTHTVGVFIVLGELLEKGVLYPPRPSLDLVYSAFYHPLGFAPIALLPGEGLGKVFWLRVLVGAETIGCLACVVLLARRSLRGVLALQPALWALATVPVAFALVGMRDDPRATLFGLLAVLAFLRGGRLAPLWATALLVLAFFTKATAPFAPGLALFFEASRRGGLRQGLALLAAAAGGVAVLVAVLQWGLGCDFLHNGLYYAIIDPAKEPRTAAQALAALGNDLVRNPSTTPVPGVLPVLLATSTALVAARAWRRRLDVFDVLVLGHWVKTLLAYRSIGTELNHLLDLSLAAALHLGVRLGGRLGIRAALVILGGVVVLGWPVRRILLPPPGIKPLTEGHVATVAAGLRGLPRVRTLCEEPLIAWEAGLRPLVTDPLLTFATLKRFPDIRETWFGPPDRPGALQRILLMRDPRPGVDPNYPHPGAWYGPIHFDREFLEELRAHWRVLLATDGVVVLVRKDGG